MERNRHNIFKEARQLLKIGSPIVATQLLQTGLNFTDIVMAGNLSARDLAGISIGNAIFMPVSIFCIATLVAINPIVSHHLGARRFLEIGKDARQMLWLVLFLAIPCFFIIRYIGIVMNIVGVTEEIIPVASGYIKALSWGIFPLFIYTGLRYFSEGLAVTKPAMYTSAASILLNIGANYVLMYGKLGFPRLGAVGAGYATSIINLFGAIVFIVFISTFKPFKRFHVFSKTTCPQWQNIKEMLRIGVPNGASVTMEILLFTTVSVLMGTLSVTAAAAHQIAINVASTTFMIPFGLSMAISQRVGFSMGQGSKLMARFRGEVGIMMCLLFMSVSAIFLFSFPEFIVRIYTDDPAVSDIAVSLLFMAAIFQISDGLQVGGFGALRGLKDTRVPMVINFVSYWLIGFSIGYFLGIHQNMGPKGLWIGLILGLTFAAFLHNLRFLRLTKSFHKKENY